MHKTLLTLVLSMGCALSVQASIIQVFYTQNGSPDVFSASYNTTSGALTGATGIGSSQQGADGIIIGANNTVIFGGETNGGGIYQISQTGTGTPVFGSGTTNSFIVAVNQNSPISSATVFDFSNSSTQGIATIPVTGGVIGTTGTVHTVTGPDTAISDIFWASNNTAYYLTGIPGSTGDLGVITGLGGAGSFTTSAPLFTGINTAQDAVFDPFTGLTLLFGDGQVDVFNGGTTAVDGLAAGALGTAVTLPGATSGTLCGGAGGVAQLDLGTVDAAGRAYVTGCSDLISFNYSVTGGVLSISNGLSTPVGGGIKDVAVIPVPATGIPEPASFTLIGFSLIGFAFKLRRKA